MATHFFFNTSCYLLPTGFCPVLLHQDLGHSNSATGAGPLISNPLAPFLHRHRVEDPKNSEVYGLWGSRVLDHHPQQKRGEEKRGEEWGGEGESRGERGKGKEGNDFSPEQYWKFSIQVHFKGERHYSKGWMFSHCCLPAETKKAGHGWLHRLLLHSFSFCFDKISAKAAILKPCTQPLSSCSRHTQEAEKLHTWWVVRPGGRVHEEMGRSMTALRGILARDSHLRPRHSQGDLHG